MAGPSALLVGLQCCFRGQSLVAGELGGGRTRVLFSCSLKVCVLCRPPPLRFLAPNRWWWGSLDVGLGCLMLASQ